MDSQLLSMFRQMLRIRMVEERIAALYSEEEMRCPVHLSIGQEATAVGVCSVLGKSDSVFSGHRSHAHYLAKGGNLKALIAELYGKETGCSKGIGGSMHLTDTDSGFVAASPIVGSTVPIAVGAAMALNYRSQGNIVVVFLGDGAMETGVVYESINFAVLKNLPIIFVCENNFYSVYSPMSVRQPKGRSFQDLVSGQGILAIKADGNDVEDVYSRAKQGLDHIKKGNGPVFLELPTYRWREHCGPNFDNHIGYRSEDEFIEWRKKDPIERVSRAPISEAICWETEAQAISIEIDQAISFAKNSPFPSEISSLEFE
jgi:TPP-dependent pyruvate/acetoin dehydrogenase alpha subunit